MDDPDLAAQMAQLVGQPARAAAGPGPRPAGRHAAGGSRWATATPSARSPSWPTSRRSSGSWRRSTPAPRSTTSTSTRSSASSAPSAAADLRALRELERELERQGYVARGDDGPAAHPARRCAGSARPRCSRVFAQLDAGRPRRPRRPRAPAPADELHRATRPWVFGDELPIDAVRTVAQRRLRRGRPAHPAGSARWSTTSRSPRPSAARTAAVALCVDLSFSMVQEGRWGPMKQTALALAHLVETRFRAGRAADHRLRPGRAAAVAGAAGRRRAGVGAGHQPAARADARRPAPAPAPRRRAGRHGRHRRRADRAPRARRHAVLPLADDHRRRCARRWPRSTS